MPEHERPAEGPQRNQRDEKREGRSESAATPSVFVADIIYRLRERGTSQAEHCADALSQRAHMTGGEFAAAVQGLSGEEDLKQLASVFQECVREGIDPYFIQGVPALIVLNEKLLLGAGKNLANARTQLVVVLDRLTEVVQKDTVFSQVVANELSAKARVSLEDIVTYASQRCEGYWESVELMSSLYPDGRSLQCLFMAIDQVPDEEPSDSTVSCCRRALAQISELSFKEAFEFIAWYSPPSERLGIQWLYEGTILGLTDRMTQNINTVFLYLLTGEDPEVFLACKICRYAGQDQGSALTEGQRDEVSDVLGQAIRQFRASGRDPDIVGRSYLALSDVTNRMEDAELLLGYIDGQLKGGNAVTPQLMWAFAACLSRLTNVEPLEALLTEFEIEVLVKKPEAKREGASKDYIRVGGAHDTEQVFENLALELALEPRKSKVLKTGETWSAVIDSGRLVRREAESLGLFFDVRQASAFAGRHAFLAQRGPRDIVGALLPELLSSVYSAINSSHPYAAEIVFQRATESFELMSAMAANDDNFRRIATARLSPRDVEFFETLQTLDDEGNRQVPPSLACAVLAFRAGLNYETQWQEDLLLFIRELSDREKYLFPPHIIPFLSLMAETRQAGAGWELLSKVPLADFREPLLAGFACGLVPQAPRHVEDILRGLESPSGEVLARSLILTQLMVSHMTKEQGARALTTARAALDEIGVLSLDAIATLGVLSDSVEDARMLLYREPSLGVDPQLHRVTCADAAGRIMANIVEGDARFDVEAVKG